MTLRTGLENRPDTLWRLAEPLWSRAEQGEGLTQGQLDAVVEAFFRLGVHPGTAPATALTLLSRAHRLDGANPKHPYHVGLLYLRHGHPEAAVRWLTAAAELSPVNHRVQAHLSLAYRGLDERRAGTPGYTGEHRARAEEIEAAVREGRDDFDPEAGEPVLPLLWPGVCRWTGVHDMAADGRLRGRTAERTRDTLHADLEAVAALAERRRGGTASFTVLAVQWMVYGYPPATVRRLMKRLPPDDGPAGRLLSLVCELFETDPGGLPDRLAVCLAEGSLPDVLVALIHRRRLFRRPLRFPDLGAHAAARAFTDGDPVRHEKALAAAWRTLTEEPPGPMADVPRQEGPEEAPAAGPDERLAVLVDTAAALRGLREDARARAKALGRETVTDAAGYARLAGDREILAESVDRLEAVRQCWVEEVRRFKGAEPAGLVMPFAEFQRRLEECEAEFQEPLGSMRRVLKKGVDRKLAARRAEFTAVTPEPSPGALDFAARLTGLESREPSALAVGAPQPPGPDARLAAFEGAADLLTGLMDDALGHAKGLTTASVEESAGWAQVAGDQGVLAELVDRWEHVRLARLEDLRHFKDTEPTGLAMPFAEFQHRLETCEARLQQSPGSLRNILNKRVGRRLAARRAEFGTLAPTPSDPARDLVARLTALEEQDSGAPSGDPVATAVPGSPPAGRRPGSPPAPPGDADAGARVAHALATAEEQLSVNFTEARATLDAYPPGLRQREAVRLLRGHLDGQQAEAELRLGRTTAARRRWNAMLADDPLHPAVLRNLAVAHTSAGDLAHAALAWRRCLEALYLRDLLHGDIRRGAAERAEVHRVLAGSFGTAPLVQGMTPRGEPDQDDHHRIPPVLASRAKVGTAAAHLRLDEVNHFLTHRGPTLLLGVGRSVGETELAAARDGRRAAVATAVAALPARVREPFEQACVRLIEEAYDEASRAKGRTRRHGDEAEERTQLAWAQSRVLWKAAIHQAVVQPDAEADWALTEYSGDVLVNLRLIDALPLDPTDEIVLAAARQVGHQGDPEPFVRQYNRLAAVACDHAVSRIYDAARDTASDGGADRFPDRFRRIGLSWVRSGVPERYIDLLDDPQDVYAPSVASAFEFLNTFGPPIEEQERKLVAAAVTAQERWVRRMPGATGPAIVLAHLLSSLGRHDDVAEVLSKAKYAAFDDRGRQKLTPSYIRLDIDRGRHAETVPRIRTLLEAAPDDPELRGLLVHAYSSWINSGENPPSTRTVTEDFARWTDDKTVALRRSLVLAAAMAAYRARHLTGGTGPLVAELRRVCLDDPGHEDARYQFVEALYKHAFELRKEIQGVAGEQRRALRTEFQKLLAECEHQARAALAGGGLDKERRARIEEILRGLRPE
ncbi:hypothetical protein [Streptomyces geranii]|uniref:hypothetical protein n=1 Tax=Streptomyces geranii TaxID=2058923 RepID=UPI000D03720C|nr:hypothetical protein [Streptomyces geranii]